MSDAAWAVFDLRAQGDYTRAVARIKALLLASSDEWDLPSVPTDELERVAKVTRLRLLSPTTGVAPAKYDDLARLDQFVEAALHARAGAELPGDTPSHHKLEAYSDLMEAQAVLLADPPDVSGAVVREIHRLEAAGAALRAQEPVRYLADDLASMIFALGLFEAQTLRRAGDPGTRATYERAIETADRFGLATEAASARIEFAQYLFTATAAYDEALALILPHHEAMLAGTASLERAHLLLLMARLYVDLPSLHEARASVEAAAADLAALGYPRLADPPDPTPWFVAADHNSGSAFRATAIAVADAHFTLAGLESRLATTEDEAAAARARLGHLEVLIRTIVDHVAAAGAEEQRTVAALSSPDAPAASGPHHDQELAVRQRKLIEWHGRLVDRVLMDAVAVDLEELRACRGEAAGLGAEAVAINLLGLEGQVLHARGRRDDACAVWREAFDRGRAAGRLGDSLWWLDWIAHAHLDPPDHARVSALAGEAIALIEEHRAALSTAYLASDFLHGKDHFYRMGIAAARKLGDVGLLLARGELIKSRGILHQGISSAGGMPPGALADEMADITARLAAAPPEDAEVLRERRRIVWDRLAIERARSSGAALPPRFDLAALQAAIDDDTVVINYLWLERGVLLVIGIDRTRAIESLQLIDEGYDALIGAIDEMGRLDREMTPPFTAIDRFAGMLFPQPVAAMLAGKQRCILSPHQHLHRLPFHAVRVNGEYLLRQIAVSYVPNLTSLLLQRPAARSEAVLAIGVGRSFNVPSLALRELKSVGVELAALRKLYERRGREAEFLVNEDATLAAVRALAASGRMADYRVLHVATHGSDVDGDSPMEAFLALADGVLDGLEISGFRLDADLVVLPACFSGKRGMAGREMSAPPGDDLFGLQAAFFAAGARAVLGALWELDDRAAQLILPALHERLADLTPPEALQGAVLEYLDGAGVLSAGRYYWAPLFVSSLFPSAAN